MSWMASKQITTNQNYSLFVIALWNCQVIRSLCGAPQEFCHTESIYSDLTYELLIVSTYWHQFWIVHHMFRLKHLQHREKMCLCDLDLELCIALQAGYMPGIFMLFLLHFLVWYGELNGSGILGLEWQDKRNCWAEGELPWHTMSVPEAFPCRWLKILCSTAPTDGDAINQSWIFPKQRK